MFWKTVSLTAILLIICSEGFSSDLYVLTIDSQEELQSAEKIVSHAYGMIGEKFIVELEDVQAMQLNSANVGIEFIGPGFAKGRYHLVRKADPDVLEVPVKLSPLFTEGGAHIMELEPGSADILFRSGYHVLPIGERQTPLFYRAQDYDKIVILDNYPTDTLADLINQDSLYNYVVRMEEFYTRFIGSDSAPVVNAWLIDRFQDMGYYNISYNSFSASSDWCGSYSGNSVICLKQGSEKPDRYILVGAHKDDIVGASCGLNPNAFAPGCDDNASGVAAVFELARLFKDFDNKKSIMFAAFGGEELGLFGAYNLAQQMYNLNTDLELMVNLDMVGYTQDDDPDAITGHHNCVPFLEVFKRCLLDVSQLVPEIREGINSDQQAFEEYGFSTIFLHEGDFNDVIHTTRDYYNRMDFEYLALISKTLVTSIAIIDQLPDPLVFWINDIGDGQSVRVSWDSEYDDADFTLVRGPLPTFLDDTVDIPPGSPYYDIEDLTEGVPCYISVYQTVEGIPQLTYSVVGAASQTAPRPPTGVVAEPDTNQIRLSWLGNSELDISHYQIFRKAGENPWEMLADNHTELDYMDFDVTGGCEHFYRLCAVDEDGYVSDSSEIVSCFLATFDGGVLLVDETQSGGINPSEGSQSGFYRLMMGEISYSNCRIDATGDPLGHALLSQYNSVFWIDDDNFNHMWNQYEDTLQWFFDYGNDFLFAGWNSIYDYTGHTYFYPGSFLYDEFGISYVGSNILGRFVGANGEGDWPDLVVKPDAPNDGHLPDIQVFDTVPGSEVIYRFDTDPYHSGFQDRPVGIAYDTYNGKRVILGFPLYWLTLESAQALINRVLEYFAAPSIPPPPPPPGDVNGDKEINLLDVTYLISYLYKYGSEPPDLNNADPNGDCIINILDITFLISYLYKGGPEPVEGCVL